MSRIAELEEIVNTRTAAVTIQLADPDDLEEILSLSLKVNRPGYGLSMPEYAQRRYLTSLMPRWEQGRLMPSGEGFIVVADMSRLFTLYRERELVGCLTCEYQRCEHTGEYVAYLSTFYCKQGVPLKTAHRMVAFAGRMIWQAGVNKLMLSIDGWDSHKAYRAFGIRPVSVLCECDLAELMQRLKERGV
jgi:hypothetical protein